VITVALQIKLSLIISMMMTISLFSFCTGMWKFVTTVALPICFCKSFLVPYMFPSSVFDLCYYYWSSTFICSISSSYIQYRQSIALYSGTMVQWCSVQTYARAWCFTLTPRPFCVMAVHLTVCRYSGHQNYLVEKVRGGCGVYLLWTLFILWKLLIITDGP
jgi:hypothetical protein